MKKKDVNAGEVSKFYSKKKALWSDSGKLAISKGLEHLHRLYAKGASKIKNKKIKSLLNSGAAHSLVNLGTKRLSSAVL